MVLCDNLNVAYIVAFPLLNSKLNLGVTLGWHKLHIFVAERLPLLGPRLVRPPPLGAIAASIGNSPAQSHQAHTQESGFRPGEDHLLLKGPPFHPGGPHATSPRLPETP